MRSTTVTRLGWICALCATGCFDDPAMATGSSSTGGDTTATSDTAVTPSSSSPATTANPPSTSSDPETSTGIVIDTGTTTVDEGTTTGSMTSGTTTGLVCVDDNIGMGIGVSVASGNTMGQGDDFDLAFGGCFGGGSGGFIGTDDGGFVGSGGAFIMPPPPPPGGLGGGDDFVIEWTPPENGLYTITLENSMYDTMLGVAEPACGGEFYECNDDCYGAQSAVLYEATAGFTVYIVVDGYSGKTGIFQLNIYEGNTMDCGFGSGTDTFPGTDSFATDSFGSDTDIGTGGAFILPPPPPP